MKIDAREDWFIRWISMHDLPTTEEVFTARRAIDNTEARAKVLSALQKLQKAGFVRSRKSGRELQWTATRAGEKAMA